VFFRSKNQRIFGGAEACPDSLAGAGCNASNNFFRLNHSIGPHFCSEISSRSPHFYLTQLSPYFWKFVAIGVNYNYVPRVSTWFFLIFLIFFLIFLIFIFLIVFLKKLKLPLVNIVSRGRHSVMWQWQCHMSLLDVKSLNVVLVFVILSQFGPNFLKTESISFLYQI